MLQVADSNLQSLSAKDHRGFHPSFSGRFREALRIKVAYQDVEDHSALSIIFTPCPRFTNRRSPYHHRSWTMLKQGLHVLGIFRSRAC